jgi:hypothetical protein
MTSRQADGVATEGMTGATDPSVCTTPLLGGSVMSTLAAALSALMGTAMAMAPPVPWWRGVGA